jgi:hypothetical protein
MKLLLCTALVLGLAACADTPATNAQLATAASSSPPTPVVCERVAPTGSNLSVTRCAPAATAADHMAVRDAVRTMAGPGAPAAGPDGH